MKARKVPVHVCAAARALIIASFAFFGSTRLFLAQSFTYDFPGTPAGSGVVTSQGSAQPSGGTFSNFTATGVSQNLLGADVFATTGWSTSGAINTSQFVSYSFTPSASNISFLQQVSFDVRRAAAGPSNGQVSLFGNTANAALASQSIALTGTLTPTAFNFTDIITEEALTVRFYAWDTFSARDFILDNVTTTGATSNFQANGATLTLTNPTQLYADTAALTFSGAITGSGTLQKIGSNTVTLTGASNYTGATTISAGTLKVDFTNTVSAKISGTSSITINSGGTLLFAQSGATASNNRINDAAAIFLNGGTLNTGGLQEHGASNNTAGMGALTLQSSSVIDMGSGNSIIAFLNSSANAAAWGTGRTLDIWNYTGTPLTGGGTDRLYFGSDATGLTAAQLIEIHVFSGAGTGLYVGATLILASGEVVPIPEPSTWAAAALAAAVIGYQLSVIGRRRLSS